MLGSPRKHKTLTRALQYLHITLSGGALSCNQNSDYLLNSIQIWESTDPDRRPLRPAIWLSDIYSFMPACPFLHNLDETQLDVTTKLCRWLFFWTCSVVEYGFPLQPTNYFHVFSGPWDLFGSQVSQKYSKAKITVASAQQKSLFEVFLTTCLRMNAAPSIQNSKTDHYTTPNCLKFSSWSNFLETIEAFHYHWSDIEFNF